MNSPIGLGKFLGQPVTLCIAKLETGRFHQIRAQCAAIQHPVVGDLKYGASRTQSFGRPALHSYFLEFPHPKGGEIQKFEIEDPPDFKKIEKSSA